MSGSTEPVLRPWRDEDAAALLEACASSPDLGRQLGGAELASIAAASDFIRRFLVDASARLNWAIVAGDRAVGNVGLSAIELVHESAWVSYWLALPARGNGWACRALATVAEAAFADGLHRLELGHRVNNPASCAVAVRSGFAVEGIEREKLRYGQERFDVERHARLASDPSPPLSLLRIESAA